MGPQRFISGSICPSNPFERELSFASPSKRAAEPQSFWRLSNTDAPVCLHQWAVSPALRLRSSEKEKKLSNRPAASSFFQSFRRDRRRQSPISQLICQISQRNFDRSHLNASHRRRARMQGDRSTDNGQALCAWAKRYRVGGQRKRRMKGENVVFGVHLSNSQVAIDPRQSMRSGFHYGARHHN